MPGAGSLLVSVATASGATPVVAGKPHRPMAALVAARCSDLRAVVGDRPSTDGLFAARIDVPFALVLSGVTPADGPPPDPRPVVSAPDLDALIQAFLRTN
jgi:ribonucleotide monophosphatase NagD (HAD superfamily)